MYFGLWGLGVCAGCRMCGVLRGAHCSVDVVTDLTLIIYLNGSTPHIHVHRSLMLAARLILVVAADFRLNPLELRPKDSKMSEIETCVSIKGYNKV